MSNEHEQEQRALSPSELLADETPMKAPPMSRELMAAMEEMEPVRPRRPRREFLFFSLATIPVFGLALSAMGLRQDLGSVSLPWLTLISLTWLGGFFAAAYLGIVPGRGRVMNNSKACRVCAGVLGVLFIALGLVATQGVCGSSLDVDSRLSTFVRYAPFCTVFGILGGVVPGAVLLAISRPTLPNQGRVMGLTLGASGASLAGLVLQFHCHSSERFHVAFTHGAPVVLAAALLAVIGQRMARVQ